MKSIRTKIQLSTLCIVIASCAILSITMLLLFYKASIQNMEESVASNVSAYVLSVENRTNVFRKEIELVAQRSDITNTALSLEQRKAILADEAKKTGFKDFSVSDQQGKTYSDTDIADRDYFKSAITGVTYISSPVIRRTDGSVTIMSAAKIDNGTGFNGAVYGGISYDIFSELIANITIGNKGYGFIVDRNGTLIAHPDPQVVAEFTNYPDLAQEDATLKPLADLISKMSQGQTGSGYYNMNGARRFAAYVPIQGPEGWSLAVSADVADMLSDYNQSLQAMIAVSLVLVALSVVASLLVARPIARPIAAVTRRLEQLSTGDLQTPSPSFSSQDETGQLSRSLTHTISQLKNYIADITRILTGIAQGDLALAKAGEYEGDFVPIRQSLDTIVDALNQIFAEMNESAQQVHDGSAQVSYGAQNLSQSTVEQAAAIEQLSASIQSVSRQSEEGAQSAAAAANLSRESGEAVLYGDEQMQKMLRSMQQIHDSSQEIFKINKVIEDIAFQTNILALNAAVEAARAGASGRGFAVVAEEVKNLANKSAEAARTTNELISTSIASIEEGYETANQTAQALNRATDKVQQVSTIMDTISTTVSDQAQSIQQITQGISQISGVVQANSAIAEQSAAASEEMSSQAELLKERISRFKLRGKPQPQQHAAPALPKTPTRLRLSDQKENQNLGKY